MSYFPLKNRIIQTGSTFATLLLCGFVSQDYLHAQQPALAPPGSSTATLSQAASTSKQDSSEMAPPSLESVLSDSPSDSTSSAVPKSVLSESKVAEQENPAANSLKDSTAKPLATAKAKQKGKQQINNGRPYYRMINGRLVYFPNSQSAGNQSVRQVQFQSPLQNPNQVQQPRYNQPRFNQPAQYSPRPGLFRRLFGRR